MKEVSSSRMKSIENLFTLYFVFPPKSRVLFKFKKRREKVQFQTSDVYSYEILKNLNSKFCRVTRIGDLMPPATAI